MAEPTGAWRTFIAQVAEKHEFFPPADPIAIAEAELALQVTLPDDLRQLLTETNGVRDGYGSDVIWPVQDIVKHNLEFRSSPDFAELYMPFEPLLFFADSGNGDQFAFIINTGAIRRDDIFQWEHETDSRSWYARALSQYLQKILEEV